MPTVKPGFAFGGSCLPKDVQALHRMAQGVGVQLPMLKAVQQINDRQRQLLADRLDTLLPSLMAQTGIDMWLVISREYNEDPVMKTFTVFWFYVGNHGAYIREAETPEDACRGEEQTLAELDGGWVRCRRAQDLRGRLLDGAHV